MKYTLTETKLRSFINKAVRTALNEVRGWSLEEDDVTWVNDGDEGDKAWMVRLWPGAGYYLPAFAAYAGDEESALCYVVAWLEKECGGGKFFVDDAVEREREEMEQQGMSEDEIDASIEDWAFYVDATIEGASEPHYVYLENLSIYPFDATRFK